jgi:hypothetical protein
MSAKTAARSRLRGSPKPSPAFGDEYVALDKRRRVKFTVPAHLASSVRALDDDAVRERRQSAVQAPGRALVREIV